MYGVKTTTFDELEAAVNQLLQSLTLENLLNHT
jgi:hypothetical protein